MRRNRGISTNKYISELTTYYRGWIGYFYYGVTNRQLEKFDGYARQRLRVILWKQWKSSKKRKKMLKKYSVSKKNYTYKRIGFTAMANKYLQCIIRNNVLENEFGYNSLVKMFINLGDKKSKSETQGQLTLFEL